MKKNTWIFGLLLVAAIFAVGCSSDDPADPQSGIVSLYASSDGASVPPPPVDVPAGLTSVNVAFSSLSLYNTAGSAVALAVSADAPVDLLASFSDANSLVGTFQIPAGDYNGVSGQIDVVSITDAATGFTCDVGGSYPIPRITLSQPFLTVNDDGTAAFLVELPVQGGSCPSEGGAGSITFGTPSVTAIPID